MNLRHALLMGAAASWLLTGCTSAPVILSPVGPGPAGQAVKSSMGYLRVFSATEKSIPLASDDSTLFNLHSGYDIQNKSGQTLQFVSNHASNMDEWPDLVALPAGIYHVVARSSCCGQIAVPVLIVEGKTTAVHLDRDWLPPASVPASRLVFLPDGEAVGWSSQVREQ